MSGLGRFVRLFMVSVLVAVAGSVAVAEPASAAGPTTISVSSSANPSSVGQSVSFSATVQAVTIPPPLLVVTFLDGSSLLGVAVLVPDFGTFCKCIPTAHSTATFSTSGLSQGSHTIRAIYLGDADNGGSTGSMTQTVTALATTTTVIAVPNPSVFGQEVNLFASVATVPVGIRTPAGQIKFHLDGADLGLSITLDGSGNASIPVAGLVVGGHTITASFASTDPNVLDSSGTMPALLQVSRADTSTTLNSSVTPAVYGQPVTLTATPSAVTPGAGTPSGTVTFTDGPARLGAGPVGGGQASITLTSLKVGSHPLLGSYSGDGNFNPSSGTVIQQITQAPTITTVSSSANPSVYGQLVTFTATECPGPPSSQPALPPSGSVIFVLDGAATPFDAQTLTVAPGLPGCSQATSAPTAALSVGPPAHSIKVDYPGDVNFLPSTSSLPGGQTVNKDATSTAVVSAHNPAFFGDPLSLTVTVLATPPGAGIPTGTVTFTDGSATLGTATLAGGQAIFTNAGLQVGTHSIVATYTGDGNFLTSASPALNQEIRCTTTITGRVNGGLAITTGSTCLQGATINGGITVATGAALSMRDSTVNGGIGATSATALTSCNSAINGATTIQASSGFVLLGDAGDDGYACGANTFHGNVTLLNNRGQLEVGANDIRGGLTLTGTSGAGPTPENRTSEIEANNIRGDLACFANIPAPTSDSQPDTTTGQQSGQCANPF